MNAGSTRPDSALLAAWRSSEYRVDQDNGPALILHIDRHCPALARLMRSEGIGCAAYITAENPFSHIASEAQNSAARVRLEARLTAARWRWLSGLGGAPDSDYPDERSVLVLGIQEHAAVVLGRAFSQHAILVIGADAIPRLRLM